MRNGDVIVSDDERPANQSTGRIRDGRQPLQRLVIRAHRDLAPKDIRPEVLQRLHHRQALALWHRVAALRLDEHSRVVGNRVGVAIVIQLRQHRSSTDVTRINMQLELARPVGIHQHRRGGQGVLELVKRLLRILTPLERHPLLGQAVQRQRHPREVLDEPTIEVGHTQKRTYTRDSGGLWKGLHRRDLVLTHSNPLIRNDVAQVLHLTREKLTLGQLHRHARVSHPLQHVAQVLTMCLEGGAEDDDVINVAQGTYPHEPLQHQLHCPLEERWTGGQALRCAVKLEAAPLSGEGRLVAVLLRDGDLIIAGRQIKGGKVHSSVERI